MTIFYLVNTRMHSKQDIKKGLLCMWVRGVVLGIVGRAVTFGFLIHDAISDENMPFIH